MAKKCYICGASKALLKVKVWSTKKEVGLVGFHKLSGKHEEVDRIFCTRCKKLLEKHWSEKKNRRLPS
ncbi:MAG: hypothetical protein KJ906_01850 [Nanoarchaeota archaeon]|nr:hypothetical protein [Nanoarchaeota archaeon]